MLNCTLTIPYIVILSYIPVSSLQNAKDQLYPAIDRLDTPISIIIPIKLSAAQRDVNVVILQVKGSQLVISGIILSIVQRDVDMVVLQVKGSQSVIRGTILSIVVTKWLKALLAKVVAIEIALCCSTWPKEVQQ